MRRAIEPKTTLTVLTLASGVGAAVYLVLVLLTNATMQPLYFGLIVLMCAIGIAALYILHTSQALAITVYAWLAGICLAAMMAHDALRGERYDHLLWVYPAGIVYIIIHVGRRHAFLYAIGSSFVGLVLGLCEARYFDCIFYALMPLAAWVVAESIANVICYLRQQTDDLTALLETWERAERR